jgi:uncharacterized protein with PIN domain
LNFLADESCDFGVVRALRKAGHDVVAMCEIARRTDDDDVIELASREDRVLITEDKDFGWLVYARGLGSHGVILLRYPAPMRGKTFAAILELARERKKLLPRSFVVLEPGRARISRLPHSK